MPLLYKNAGTEKERSLNHTVGHNTHTAIAHKEQALLITLEGL